MNSSTEINNNYRVTRFISVYGRIIPIALGTIPLVIAAIFAVFGPWGWIIVLLISTFLIYLVARSYVELVCIIADTLLPR